MVDPREEQTHWDSSVAVEEGTAPGAGGSSEGVVGSPAAVSPSPLLGMGSQLRQGRRRVLSLFVRPIGISGDCGKDAAGDSAADVGS